MKKVAVNINENVKYCYDSPFFPPQIYAEFRNWCDNKVNPNNRVYEHIRDVFHGLGLNECNWGTAKWNPFSDFIKFGDLVVIKPNFVIHHNNGEENIDAVVTHGSVIRPLVDYALLALNGTGKIIIGDAPQANADFNTIVEKNGVRSMVDYYQSLGVNIELCDLRKNCYPHGFKTGTRVDLPGDPNGYKLVNLNERSFLQDLSHKERLYGADYDRNFIVEKHKNGHEYLYSGSVLAADVVITVPKLKTHRKAGVTINAKNMVGANGDKNYLAHYRVGTPRVGGDEYPDGLSLLTRFVYKLNRMCSDHLLIKNTWLSRIIYLFIIAPFEIYRRIRIKTTGYDYMMGHGDWHGNDTVWRMCLDLNQILKYADKNGVIKKTKQRTVFSLVDGIIAGEKDGPLKPSPKNVGVVISGLNDPLTVDYVCVWQMGFSPEKIKILEEARESYWMGFEAPKTEDVYCKQNEKLIDYTTVNMHFEPQMYWIGYIER